MARIPKYMLWFRGERVSFIDVYTLETPIITAVLSEDGESITLTISNRQSGVVYTYTTDGSEPSKDDAVFEGSLSFTDSCTVTVQGYKGQHKSVPVVYEVASASSPVIVFTNSDAGGTITITCATQGATIKYKLGDGAWQTYSEGMDITEAVTVQAYAEKEGMFTSSTSTLSIGKVATPVISAI